MAVISAPAQAVTAELLPNSSRKMALKTPTVHPIPKHMMLIMKHDATMTQPQQPSCTDEISEKYILN